MSESPVGDKQNSAALDEHSISELIRFFSLLDKWDATGRSWNTSGYGSSSSRALLFGDHS